MGDSLSALNKVFIDIGVAINEKGISGMMTPLEMPNKINQIQTGITPSGTLTITENGTYDVTNYANTDVNVAGGGGGGCSYVILKLQDSGSSIGSTMYFGFDNEIKVKSANPGTIEFFKDENTRLGSMQAWAVGTSFNTNILFMPVASNDSRARTVIEFNVSGCLFEGTNILMSDRSIKHIEDLVVGDSILCIDPNSGELVSDTVVYADGNETKKSDSWDEWKFSDGTIVKTVKRHRFYNAELGEFMYMNAWENGESAYKHDGSFVRLESHTHHDETVRHFTIFTKKYNNYFANGLLSGNRKSLNLKVVK